MSIRFAEIGVIGTPFERRLMAVSAAAFSLALVIGVTGPLNDAGAIPADLGPYRALVPASGWAPLQMTEAEVSGARRDWAVLDDRLLMAGFRHYAVWSDVRGAAAETERHNRDIFMVILDEAARRGLI